MTNPTPSMLRRAAAISAVVAVASACSRPPNVDTQKVAVKRVAGTLPATDPASPAWNAAPEHPAALMVQDIAEPRLTKPGVGLVRVRALHDGTQVAFRLEWEDATRSVIPDVGQSSDAVAIQLPTQPGADVPNPAMGEAGRRVQICYWKAVWQDDAERGGTDRIAALYPQGTTDHYPFDANPAAKAEMQRRYAPAVAAGNPITVRPNGSPVQEMLAEGFGGSTTAPEQRATGRGVWANGRWTTTLARPLQEGEGLANLQVGLKTYIAFAVWDGAERHTGGRKMRSGWIPLVVEAP